MARESSFPLGPDVKRRIQRFVASGRYDTESDVVEAALSELEASEERLAQQIAYLESLPVEKPDAEEQAIIDEIEAARDSGDLEPVCTNAQLSEWIAAHRDGNNWKAIE